MAEGSSFVDVYVTPDEPKSQRYQDDDSNVADVKNPQAEVGETRKLIIEGEVSDGKGPALAEEMEEEEEVVVVPSVGELPSADPLKKRRGSDVKQGEDEPEHILPDKELYEVEEPTDLTLRVREDKEPVTPEKVEAVLSHSGEEGSPFSSDSSVPLPEGWSRKVVQRQSGRSAGKYDVYIFSPEKKKFRSRMEIQRYLDETRSDLSIGQFDFRVRGKEHTAVKAAPHNPPLRSLDADAGVEHVKKPRKKKEPKSPGSGRRGRPPLSQRPDGAKKPGGLAMKGRLVIKLPFPTSNAVHKKRWKSSLGADVNGASALGTLPKKKRQRVEGQKGQQDE